MDATSTSSLTLRELRELYIAHAEKIYRRRSGEPTREHLNLRAALARFQNYAQPASSPARINRHQVRAWLDQLATEELSRSYVNACLSRLRRFVRWAADLEYIPLSVDAELRLVRPLAPLRSAAKEKEPRPAITPDHLAAIIAHVPRWAVDVIQLLRLTAARPEELATVTNAEVHLDAAPRITPMQHKTAWRGKHRIIALSPAAVLIVQRHHRPFCPADPLFRSSRSEPATMNALEQAWCRARRRAGLEHLQLYDLRRTAARQVRKAHGLDAAQALLGHSHAHTTEIYAPIDAVDSATFNTARTAAEVLQ